MKPTADTFNILPKRTLELQPQEFLALTPGQRANMQNSRFVPPRPGCNDFGHIEVTLKTPEYSPGHGK